MLGSSRYAAGKSVSMRFLSLSLVFGLKKSTFLNFPAKQRYFFLRVEPEFKALFLDENVACVSLFLRKHQDVHDWIDCRYHELG